MDVKPFALTPPIDAESQKDKEKARRGYRACLHCRSRKAKCDLGDIAAPSSPPCSRCKRESRECVFAPSRRGGNNAKRRRDESDPTNASTSPPKPPSIGAEWYNPSAPVPHSPPARPYSPQQSSSYYSSRPAFPHDEPSGTSLASFKSDAPSSSSSLDKRRKLNKPDAESILQADMQNEADALHILAIAAGRPPSPKSRRHPTLSSGTLTPAKKQLQPARIEDFALVKLGILDGKQVATLVDAFFRFYHHFFPMVPAERIPRSREQLAQFACSERYLTSAMVIIASRHDRGIGMRLVHERAWSTMRGWISEVICFGAPPTVGLVEALLLLAEHLPRDPAQTDAQDPTHAQGLRDEAHGAENRQAWIMIGMAIRSAYSLGLDKLAVKVVTEAEKTFEVERARLVWTYCYLFDRHVSLRLGKAFWSRGPNVCFQGFSTSGQTGPAAAPANFPLFREMNPSPGHDLVQDDLASLVQTYLELTQLMSNAHDVLYPNATRTRALVIHAEYFKYIDELVRSLDGFKVLWREKKWKLFPLTDAMWAMFYYTQLYICAFSFHAHVERAAMRAEEEAQTGSFHLSLFPRGAAASPDARYIFQSIDAARQLLHICVDRLHPGGALPYLPNRFLLWFTYAAILLLKAMYSGAMLRADHPEAHRLIERLIECFKDASPDEDHPAVKYGRQLTQLCRILAGMSTTAVNSPSEMASSSTPAATGQSAPHTGHNNIATDGGVGQSAAWEEGYFPQPPGELDFSAHSNGVRDVQHNLGFATLDDWFKFGANTGPEQHPVEALDLADFWMKVGPMEAVGGFPFR